jgi:hypothetical protein
MNLTQSHLLRGEAYNSYHIRESYFMILRKQAKYLKLRHGITSSLLHYTRLLLDLPNTIIWIVHHYTSYRRVKTSYLKELVCTNASLMYESSVLRPVSELEATRSISSFMRLYKFRKYVIECLFISFKFVICSSLWKCFHDLHGPFLEGS